MREAAAAAAGWQYMVDGPPDAPVFDAAAEADAAVAQLLDADVVITTYDVLQQVNKTFSLLFLIPLPYDVL